MHSPEYHDPPLEPVHRPDGTLLLDVYSFVGGSLDGQVRLIRVDDTVGGPPARYHLTPTDETYTRFSDKRFVLEMLLPKTAPPSPTTDISMARHPSWTSRLKRRWKPSGPFR